jgi:heme exporter protein B
VKAVLRKDLRLELRTPEVVPAMALFALTAFVLFHFALQRDELAGALAAGVLLVTLTLAATLGTVRLFVAEREEGGLDAFLLSPVDRTALLVAKAAVLCAFLVALEIVAVPGFTILLLGPGLSLGEAARLAGVLLLLDVGLAVVGTLVSALAVQTRARELIAPMLSLPLLVPALIASGRCVAPLLDDRAPGHVPADWLTVLGIYDLVFALLAYAVFDFLLED